MTPVAKNMASQPWHVWQAIEERTILPGLRARFLHSQHMSFALWNADAQAIFPVHSHPHEQVTQMLSGEMELTIDKQTRILKPGEVAIIPAHTAHSGKALSACRILDVFYPLREDYLGSGKGAFS